MPSPSDRLLAETAIEWGFLTPGAAEECLRLQERLEARGREVPLEQILLKKRLVGSRALERLLRHVVARGAEPRFERYAIEEKLGEGGMAVVYRARDRQLGREVALKVLKEDSHGSAERRARFVREGEAVARLRHPHVVTVFDSGEEDGRMFLVMELVKGESFDRVLARKDGLALEARVVVVEQVARAVHHAHEMGIVHRDLKPGNILVSGSGEAKVTDFGLARLIEGESSLTRSGAALGTPVYMSPEQVEGRSDRIGPATDVYALGAILYEAITGRWPHSGTTVSEIYDRILGEEPVAPRRIRPRLDPDLETIALHALEKDPSHRYQSALAFAEDLARYRAGEAVEARRPGPLMRTWRRARRRRAMVLSLLGAGLAAAALAAWVALSAASGSARIEEDLAEARRLEQADDPAGARDAYRLVLGLDGANEEARAGLARSELAVAEAEERLDADRRGGEERRAARAEAVRLLERARLALEQAVRALYREDADFAEIFGRLDEAQALVDSAIEIAPDFPLGPYVLAGILEWRGLHAAAEATLRRTLELDPAFAPARLALGRILLVRAFVANIGHDSGAMDARRAEAEALTREAALHLEEAAAGGGLGSELHVLVSRAMLAFCRREFLEVRRLAEEGIARFRGREGVEEFHWLAGVAAEGGDPLPAYGAALAIRPNYPIALFCRSWVRFHGSDLEGTLADLDRLIAIQPRFAPAYNNRGYCRRLRDDLRGALSDFDAALAIDPDDVSFRYNRALVLEQQGHRGAAIGELERVIESDPEFAPAWLNRGSLRRKGGDRAGGLADMDEALRLEPDFGVAYAARGLARWEDRDLDGAIADFEAALANSTGNPVLEASARALLRDARQAKEGPK